VQFPTIAIKIGSLYAACSPEWGVLSYGACRDEAINNLADEIRQRQGTDAEGHLTPQQ
jgi:hypothetical protein